MGGDELTIEEGLPEDSSNEAEVCKVLFVGDSGRRVDLHAHLVHCRILPESKVGVKDLLCDELVGGWRRGGGELEGDREKESRAIGGVKFALTWNHSLATPPASIPGSPMNSNLNMLRSWLASRSMIPLKES